MALEGLYRRVLPSPPAIEFSSSEGKQLFSEALQGGTMEGFFKLISYFQTQSEPAYCGLASLSVVLNALAISPRRKWKGPWRWFDESMLDCCEPLETVKAKGITFGNVACLARCAGAQVESFRTNQSTIDDFRRHVIRCSSSEDCHLITSYHRGPFKQTGSGHFSPVGGYHAERDMTLILDVARFKYPPHWVPLSLLWEAMDTVDEATGRRRGFMLISKLRRAPSLPSTLSCKNESWVKTAKYLIEDVPLLLKSDDIKSIPTALTVLFTSLPANIDEFIKWVAEVRRQEEGGSKMSDEEKARLAIKEEVLQQVHETELFKYVTEWLSSNSCCRSLDKENLPEIAASVCCQVAQILTRVHGAARGICCKATCVNCFKGIGGPPKTAISGTVTSAGNEEGFDMLVPTSLTKLLSTSCSDVCRCDGKHPAISDALTVVLLVLPRQTWSSIREQKLMEEIKCLVSTEKLPPILQEEVLHLRQQLNFLKRCQDNKVDDDDDAVSTLPATDVLM